MCEVLLLRGPSSLGTGLIVEREAHQAWSMYQTMKQDGVYMYIHCIQMYSTVVVSS